MDFAAPRPRAQRASTHPLRPQILVIHEQSMSLLWKQLHTSTQLLYYISLTSTQLPASATLLEPGGIHRTRPVGRRPWPPVLYTYCTSVHGTVSALTFPGHNLTRNLGMHIAYVSANAMPAEVGGGLWITWIRP